MRAGCEEMDQPPVVSIFGSCRVVTPGSILKAAGKLRVEGKTYIFKEGDVANFLFNV